MLIKDILLRDPSQEALVNNGQARIANEAVDENVRKELRGELSTFVCEGQYEDGIIRILSSFLAGRSQTYQKGAWVSGFFGSGKSHLLKMLAALWADIEFADGATARSLVPELPDEVRDLLRELDVAGKRSGGLLAAAGTLPSGTTDNVRLNVLSVLLQAVGLPQQYPQAQFQLWLEENNYLAQVKSKIEAAGKKWEHELNNLYVSPLLAKAILECDPNFAVSEVAARDTIKTQFPLKTSDLTTDEFLGMFKRVLKRAGKDGRIPCTILILDEVQQYIGDSETRSTLITEVAEAIEKQLDSQVMVVGAGQSALTGVKLLNKLLDRFTIGVQLSDADVETVTRKVLLRKQPASLNAITELLDSNAGEISRQLAGTKIGERMEDKAVIVADYPLLPVRRRFWEQCFRQVDVPGTHSQLRSQLRIIYDCIARLANSPLGSVIPGDDLYEALAPEMVTAGALPREINERILGLASDGKPDGRLRQRICGLVFLIGQLPSDEAASTGVRSCEEHISDLLVGDLQADNGKLRSTVGNLLDQLANDGVLMPVGDEFRIQTEEGRNWDFEFRQREAKLKNNTANFDEQRDRLLGAEIDRIVRGLKLQQGVANEARSLTLYRTQDPPTANGETIPVWIRDGFSGSEKDMIEAARAAGVSSPILYVFVPRKSRDELLNAISTEQAAEQTINAKGVPSGEPGQLAKQSMESRRQLAEKDRQSLVRDVVAGAKVFQGGGSELLQNTLEEKLETGAKAALIRLFPRFKEADFAASAWEAAIKRARDGADLPFLPLKYEGAIEQHPVCQQVLSTIGSGKAGTQVRKDLETSPFGWPRDAVDAALIALHRNQHLNATLNGVALVPGQLDQAKVPKTEFRVEKTTLSVGERIAIRALFKLLDIECKATEEAAKAPEFLKTLVAVAGEAGGQAPLPSPPPVVDIDDIRKLVGNEQLVAIKGRETDFKAKISEWKKTRELIAKRLPGWQMLEQMVKHAKALPEAQPYLTQVEAVRNSRLLLEASDPVAPIRSALADLLRTGLNAAHDSHLKEYEEALSGLNSNPTWQKLPQSDQTRILGEVSLVAPEKPDLGSDAALLAALDHKNLEARKTDAEVVASRVTNALNRAAKHLQPKIQFVTVERVVLTNETDVDAWLASQRSKFLNALKTGPVQLQ